MNDNQNPTAPLFSLGRIVATPGALDALGEQRDLEAFHKRTADLLNRHRYGDFGHVGPEDVQTNRDAIEYGNRIMSAYAIDESQPCKGWGENCLWIITEADRSVTTLLLPDEY